MKKDEISQIIATVANETINKTIGASSTTVLLCRAKPETIATDPEGFANSMHSIFGEGVDVLLRQLTTQLYERFGATNYPRLDFGAAIRRFVHLMESEQGAPSIRLSTPCR